MLELFVFLTIESNLAGIPKAHQGHSFTKKQHITYVILAESFNHFVNELHTLLLDP